MTIREIRKQYGLTQKALAERFGIPIRTIENWESELRTPPAYVVAMIEKILGYEEKPRK